jgi:hypothetical protein
MVRGQVDQAPGLAEAVGATERMYVLPGGVEAHMAALAALLLILMQRVVLVGG